jgi:diaminohydroxyphosphoribosylaminopyrimidine deaminase / 5-amino-6-(5-phosphoribosylamino)uracil reductase
MLSEFDFEFMRRALALAERGLFNTTPNPRVGCVVVRDGELIGEGFTQPIGQAHAEVAALKNCRERGNDPRGATVYVTLEPCSHFGRTAPCVHALIEAGVARVVAAIEDPNPLVSGKGLATLRNAGIEVRCGLLQHEAYEINIGFMSRMTRGLPWVRLKAAMSLDGITALPDGSSQWITSQPARDDGHRWRARACAILTGIGTVRDDNPQMTVRAVETPRQPLRVLVDSRLEVDLEANLIKGGALVYCATNNPTKQQELQDRGCEVIVLANAQGKVDLEKMMRDLAERGINELHVEAGSKLNGSLLEVACVDELLIYQAPLLLFKGAPLFEQAALQQISDAQAWELFESTAVMPDLRLRFRRPQAKVTRSMASV